MASVVKRMFIARSSFETTRRGRREFVKANETIVAEGSPLLGIGRWESISEEEDEPEPRRRVEQATAAPGEVRKVTRKRTKKKAK